MVNWASSGKTRIASPATCSGRFRPRPGFASTLTIDVNERLLDGSRNPYFLRPFVQLDRPDIYKQPLDRDTYRAQLAYRLDLRRESSAWRWLGLQQVSAYGDIQEHRGRGSTCTAMRS
jgi:hypothetical protein